MSPLMYNPVGLRSQPSTQQMALPETHHACARKDRRRYKYGAVDPKGRRFRTTTFLPVSRTAGANASPACWPQRNSSLRDCGCRTRGTDGTRWGNAGSANPLARRRANRMPPAARSVGGDVTGALDRLEPAPRPPMVCRATAAAVVDADTRSPDRGTILNILGPKRRRDTMVSLHVAC